MSVPKCLWPKCQVPKWWEALTDGLKCPHKIHFNTVLLSNFIISFGTAMIQLAFWYGNQAFMASQAFFGKRLLLTRQPQTQKYTQIYQVDLILRVIMVKYPETANRAETGKLQFWSQPSEILNFRPHATVISKFGETPKLHTQHLEIVLEQNNCESYQGECSKVIDNKYSIH